VAALMRSKIGSAYLKNQLMTGMPRSKLITALEAASARADNRR
jgi:hypothetical protein